MSTSYTCSVPGCGVTSTADRMWNLDRKHTENGETVILCGKHGYEARKTHGLKTYRLSETLELDARREAQSLATSQFFLAFKNAKTAKQKRSPSAKAVPFVRGHGGIGE